MSDSPSQIVYDAAAVHLDALESLVDEMLLPGLPSAFNRSGTPVGIGVARLRQAFALLTDEDVVRHPLFYIPLTEVEEAKRLFEYLHTQGMPYHPDDRASDSLGDRVTAGEASQLDARMLETELLEWSEYDCAASYRQSIQPQDDD